MTSLSRDELFARFRERLAEEKQHARNVDCLRESVAMMLRHFIHPEGYAYAFELMKLAAEAVGDTLTPEGLWWHGAQGEVWLPRVRAEAEGLRLGRVGFDAYGEFAGAHGQWTTFDGRPMPKWDELQDDAGGLTRQRWGAAARAITAASEDGKLLRELLAILSTHAGERGESEGAAETLRRLIAEGQVDGRAFNLGRSEGHADVAAKLREALDPADRDHLSLDGLLERVEKQDDELMDLRASLRAEAAAAGYDDEPAASTLQRLRERAAQSPSSSA